MRRLGKILWIAMCIIWVLVMIPLVLVFFVAGFVVHAGKIGIEANERLTAHIYRSVRR